MFARLIILNVISNPLFYIKLNIKLKKYDLYIFEAKKSEHSLNVTEFKTLNRMKGM